MIEQFRIQCFKAFEVMETTLERFTVFVGPNASGKTSILEALHYLTQIVDKNPEAFFVGARSLNVIEAHQSKKHLQIAVSGIFERQIFAYGLEFKRSLGAPTGEWKISASHGISSTEAEFPPRRVPQIVVGDRRDSIVGFLRHAVFLRLSAENLACKSFAEGATSRVRYDGYGLSAALADLKVEDLSKYNAVVDGLRKVVPSIQDVTLKRTMINEQVWETIEVEGQPVGRQVVKTHSGWELYFDTLGGNGIPSIAMSEGTLLALGLLTILARTDHPLLVLLDDIDRALHPKAQADLVRQIRVLLEQNPDLQIVATSHSPYLLDHLHPSEIRLTTLDESGRAHVGKLEDHPDFEKWKETMKPGEFWSAVGEDWIKDRQKQPNEADD